MSAVVMVAPSMRGALGIGGGEQVVLQCVHDLLSLCLVDREQRGRALHRVERDFGPQGEAQKKV